MVFTFVICSAGSPRVAFEYVWAIAAFFSPSMPMAPAATEPPAIRNSLRRFMSCSSYVSFYVPFRIKLSGQTAPAVRRFAIPSACRMLCCPLERRCRCRVPQAWPSRNQTGVVKDTDDKLLWDVERRQSALQFQGVGIDAGGIALLCVCELP